MMDYTMPRAHDLPSFNVGLTETKAPSNPLGIKGCGEAGAIAAPAAVINAITDAIGVRRSPCRRPRKRFGRDEKAAPSAAPLQAA